ncbi:LamG-like jellyroll fold domain-containing protein [Aeromicrobium sp.]|uniref:LamG-like jellyroll fold domain-containing protein n=1 Tax=Aeromicrobium sp. TaxID=1871063 RepID=UPI0028AB0F14|nr:LamG-like jellyroll fold domain-containing protein [Aeromicrobium sp.]
MRSLRTTSSVALVAAIGFGTLSTAPALATPRLAEAAVSSISSIAPSPTSVARQAVEVPTADVFDVDFRGGDPAEHSQGLEPTVYGEPKAAADLTTGRSVMSFDGTDDAVGYPFRSQFAKLNQGMSLECSFRFDGERVSSSGEAALCSAKEGGGFATVMSGTDVNFMIHVGGGYKSVRVPITTGAWHHTVATWDGSRLKLYLDGELVRDVAAAGTFKHPSSGADSMMLGADVNPSNQGHFFGNATMRTSRIYSEPLTAEQAAALADADRQGPAAPKADVLDLDFSSGSPVDGAQGLEARTFGSPQVRDDGPMGTRVAQFDGSGSAYLYPFETQFPKLANEMTVECVFKYDDDFQATGVETRGNLCGAKEAGGFAVVMYGDKLSFNPHIGGSYRNTGVQIESGRWYHAVGTYDGEMVRLYVNGVLAASTPATGALSSPSAGARNLVIGGDASGRDRPSFFSPSTISRVRVFSEAVDADGVLALGRDAFAGRPANYAVKVSSTTPAAGERLTKRTRFGVEFTDEAGVGRDVKYTLDGDAIAPGDDIGPGLKAGEHTIKVEGHDVFGGTISHATTFTTGNVPSAGGTETEQGGGSVRLSANATNPSGDRVRTTFREADVVVADNGRQGTLTEIPTSREFSGTDEQPIRDAVAPGDDSTLDTPSSSELPFQQFDVPVTSTSDQQVVWSGRADPAREVVLRVWNGEEWEELARSRGNAEGQVQLTGQLRSRHRHDGTVPVLVTGEDPFADDLPNEVRDAFEKPGDYDFSIAHITDTQYLSEGAVEQETPEERQVWRDAYRKATEWIAENADERKIAFTAHTGDVIENWHNVGSDEPNARAEYEVASAAQKVLDDAGMVNTVLPGNHDNLYGSDTGPEALYNDYFGPDRYAALEQSSAWQEAKATYEPWKAGDSSNNYVLFSEGDMDFVVVSLGFGVDAEEAAWADGVLKQFADRNAIVLTHAYLTPSVNPDGRGSGFSYDGRNVLDGVIRKNPNVALVLSGHEHGVSIELRRDVARKGHHVVELLADYQFYKVDSDELGLTGVGYPTNTPLQFGSSFFRLLQFDLDAGEVAVDTYSALLDNFGATEYDDRFRYNGTEDDTRLPINLTTRTTSFSSDGLVVVDPTDRVIGEETVRSGWPATVTWDGLEAGRTYAWHATSVDAASGDELPGEVSQISLFTAGSAGTDTAAPELTVPENGSVELGSVFDPMTGVKATDAVDGDVTENVQVVGEVDTTQPGTYALTYSVADANGNQTMATRIVEVEGVKAPVNTARPKVTGPMSVGSVLSVDRGTWRNDDTATFEAQWLRDGQPIRGATGGGYRLTTADIGRAISVRVTASTAGNQPVSATSTASRVAKAASTVRAKVAKKRIKAKQRAKVAIRVAAPATANGRVLVKLRGRVVADGIVRNGKVKVRLPRLAVGKHRLVIRYLGNDQVRGDSARVTLRVKR